jgi:hypothetical protein
VCINIPYIYIREYKEDTSPPKILRHVRVFTIQVESRLWYHLESLGKFGTREKQHITRVRHHTSPKIVRHYDLTGYLSYKFNFFLFVVDMRLNNLYLKPHNSHFKSLNSFCQNKKKNRWITNVYIIDQYINYSIKLKSELLLIHGIREEYFHQNIMLRYTKIDHNEGEFFLPSCLIN